MAQESGPVMTVAVEGGMQTGRNIMIVVACVLGAGITAAYLARSAYGSEFTAFAEDENVCRKVGAGAIGGVSGPIAAQHYDLAYRRCMAAHGRMRQMRAFRDAGPSGGPIGNPHSFEYPDAFYSIPYATPGYGYDGFGY